MWICSTTDRVFSKFSTEKTFSSVSSSFSGSSLQPWRRRRFSSSAEELNVRLSPSQPEFRGVSGNLVICQILLLSVTDNAFQQCFPRMLGETTHTDEHDLLWKVVSHAGGSSWLKYSSVWVLFLVSLQVNDWSRGKVWKHAAAVGASRRCGRRITPTAWQTHRDSTWNPQICSCPAEADLLLGKGGRLPGLLGDPELNPKQKC